MNKETEIIDYYSLELPVSIDYKPDYNGMIYANNNLFNEVYKIASYFKQEFDYDRIPFNGFESGNIEVVLFSEEAYDKVQIISEPEPYRIYGACLFEKIHFTDEPKWKLKWIWFHPFFRHRGNLKKNWEELEKRYSDFLIGEPVSNDMQNFLKKIKSKHEIL